LRSSFNLLAIFEGIGSSGSESDSIKLNHVSVYIYIYINIYIFNQDVYWIFHQNLFAFVRSTFLISAAKIHQIVIEMYEEMHKYTYF